MHRRVVALGLGLVSLAWLTGCQKPAPEPPDPVEHGAMQLPAGPDSATGTSDAAAPAAPATDAAAALPEGANTICPVMGKPAKAKFHADYNGKTYYFCCGMCPAKFEKEPEKYLARLTDLEAKAAAGEDTTTVEGAADHDEGSEHGEMGGEHAEH